MAFQPPPLPSNDSGLPQPPPLLGQVSAARKTPLRPPPLTAKLSALKAQIKGVGLTPKPRSQILNLEELQSFRNLLLFAQNTVEGFFSGKHRSPLRGSSAEFTDYKEYTPGDDIARLDWRVYGRTRRLYLRQFEEETDMTVYLLVDVSASMRYAGEKRQSKFILAAKIAAALAYLTINQGDKVALTLFADRVLTFIPPAGARRALHQIVSQLERVSPSSKTGLAQALLESNPLFKKRGQIVLLSDLLDDSEMLFDALSQFSYRKFEVLLLHILDPDELNLPASSVAKFVDLETGDQVQVDPAEIRAAYQKNMQTWISHIASSADNRGIRHDVVSTANPYSHALEAYLGFRGKQTLVIR